MLAYAYAFGASNANQFGQKKEKRRTFLGKFIGKFQYSIQYLTKNLDFLSLSYINQPLS